MLKRTLFFSNPFHLSTKSAQLQITNKNTGDIKTAPIEDLGFVILDHREITFTQSVLSTLAANNTAVIICNEKHLPVSMMFHLDTHQLQSERFSAQVQAGEPLKKQLWQQTVKAKIRNQAALLQRVSSKSKTLPYQALLKMASRVKSGDTANEEAQAARRYWPALFGPAFKRERYGIPPNPSLNYAYAILRAAVARALCGSGLLPTLGIHHHNKYNAYCLADDIMEPYRPFADALVIRQMKQFPQYHNMTTEIKAGLLAVLSEDVLINHKKRPLMIALSETTASLNACFHKESLRLKLPAFVKEKKE